MAAKSKKRGKPKKLAKKSAAKSRKPKSKKVSWLPKGHQQMIPYLMVTDGDKMVSFLAKAFGAKVDHVSRDVNGEFRHGSFNVFGGKLMMGKAFGEWKAMPCSLYVYVKNADAAHKAALATGATEIMPPMDMFYGDRHGGVTDPCGNQWWLATHIEDVSKAELTRRVKIEMKRRAEQGRQVSS